MINELLEQGRTNAKSSKELCEALHLDRQALVAQIRRERLEGHLICASKGNPAGYFIAETQGELNGYSNMMLQEALAILETRQTLLMAGNNLPA